LDGVDDLITDIIKVQDNANCETLNFDFKDKVITIEAVVAGSSNSDT